MRITIDSTDSKEHLQAARELLDRLIAEKAGAQQDRPQAPEQQSTQDMFGMFNEQPKAPEPQQRVEPYR